MSDPLKDIANKDLVAFIINLKKAIDPVIPPGCSYIVLVFADPNESLYVKTAPHKETIVALREVARRIEDDGSPVSKNDTASKKATPRDIAKILWDIAAVEPIALPCGSMVMVSPDVLTISAITIEELIDRLGEPE